MKVSTDKSNSFTPFTLNVEIETEQDLATLWHIFNGANIAIQTSTKNIIRLGGINKCKSSMFHVSVNRTIPIFDELDNKVEELGLMG